MSSLPVHYLFLVSVTIFIRVSILLPRIYIVLIIIYISLSITAVSLKVNKAMKYMLVALQIIATDITYK